MTETENCTPPECQNIPPISGECVGDECGPETSIGKWKCMIDCYDKFNINIYFWNTILRQHDH